MEKSAPEVPHSSQHTCLCKSHRGRLARAALRTHTQTIRTPVRARFCAGLYEYLKRSPAQGQLSVLTRMLN